MSNSSMDGSRITAVLFWEGISVAGETAAEYYQRLSDLSASVFGGFSSGVGPYESNVREDFNSDSVHFHNLQVIELAQCASDILYLNWSGGSGDNGMVKGWSCTWDLWGS